MNDICSYCGTLKDERNGRFCYYCGTEFPKREEKSKMTIFVSGEADETFIKEEKPVIVKIRHVRPSAKERIHQKLEKHAKKRKERMERFAQKKDFLRFKKEKKQYLAVTKLLKKPKPV